MTMEELALPIKGAMRDGPFGSNLKSSHFVDEGIKVIRTQNIKKTGYVDQNVAYITPEKAKELERYEFKPGDLVIAKLGSDPGVAAVIPESCGTGIIPADVVRFRGDPRIIDHHYLARFLNSPKAKQQIEKRSRGSTRTRVNLTALREIVIDVPTLEEQRRIVTILDKVEEIANDVSYFTSREEYFIRSIFSHMFGDVMSNEKNWKQDSLGEHMNLINGRAYSRHELLGEGTPIIRIQNLKGGQRWYYSDLKLPDSKYCDNGDLLFAWSATFGPFQWKGGRSIYHYHIWKIELESTINKEFAFWLLDALTLSIKNQSHGASMLHYGKGKMEQLQIPVPPIQLQTQFSEIVSYIQSMKLTQNLDRIIELKKSTIQEMLT